MVHLFQRPRDSPVLIYLFRVTQLPRLKMMNSPRIGTLDEFFDDNFNWNRYIDRQELEQGSPLVTEGKVPSVQLPA